MGLFRKSTLYMAYFSYLFLCFVITDKIYSKCEKFPIQYYTLIIQNWNPVAFKASDIPGLIYEMVPNLRMKDIHVETNSMGIRAKECLVPKPPNTFRILILGDSIAYGVGLDQKELFSTLLEDKLNIDENSIRYEVINASIPGYNTTQEYIAFINKWYIYKPDLVLVCLCNNDMGPAFVQAASRHGIVYSYLKYKLSKMKEDFSVENITPYEMLSISMPNIFHLPLFIHRRLILFSSIYRRITIKIYDFLTIKNPYKYPPQAYFNIVKDQTEYVIKHLKFYCGNNGMNLIFILFPDLYDTYSQSRIYDRIVDAEKILKNNSIDYINLRPYYQSDIDNLSKLRLRKEDICHLNSVGHKLTAEVLYNYLLKYLKYKQKDSFAK